jgi:hypothetical protein
MDGRIRIIFINFASAMSNSKTNIILALVALALVVLCVMSIVG